MTLPTFSLYGEAPQPATKDFVHVEPLDARSRPSEWTIRPHIHAELAHIFLLTDGSGALIAEERRSTIAMPGLLFIPARIAHGFDFAEGTRGWVVTIASLYLAELMRRHPDFAGPFAQVQAVPLSQSRTGAVARQIAGAARELGWAAAGHRAAIESRLLGLMVLMLRSIAGAAPPVDAGTPRQAALVARFRARVEDRFRRREPVTVHAAALGVSLTALRNACARVAGMPPALILDKRTVLEAQRALLYSRMTVAEVGYSLGFADPAYFSRFFTRHVGRPPRAYRA